MTEITAEMIERGRGLDPQVATQKRRLGARVREARERLTTSDTGHRGADLELLRAYAEARMNASLSAVALILMTSGLSLYWVPPQMALIWMVLAFSRLILCHGVAKNFRALEDDKVAVKDWRTKFVVTELIHGIVWAGVAALLLAARDPNARVLVLLMLILSSAFNAMLTATIPAAVYAAIAPASLAAVAYIVYANPNHGGQTFVALLAMVATTQLFFYVLARRFHHLASESLFFRAEKNELIAELEQAKANSDEARRRAEEANLAKSRFLATMSHELRTPLNAILGFSDVMANELMGAHIVDAYRDYAKDIHASGEHLLNIINEILDLSRVEAGRYELREEALHLAAVAEECRHMLQLRAKAKSIRVTEEIDPTLDPLWADEKAVRQICLNLLSNAIKFTPQNGEVKIIIGRDGAGGQKIEVVDTGPGIPDKELPLVLESFGRGSLAIKTAEQGTGLGLPIVKGLIDLHGGSLDLQSRLREGTRVIVRFPASRVISAMHAVHERRPPAYKMGR